MMLKVELFDNTIFLSEGNILIFLMISNGVRLIKYQPQNTKYIKNIEFLDFIYTNSFFLEKFYMFFVFIHYILIISFG